METSFACGCSMFWDEAPDWLETYREAGGTQVHVEGNRLYLLFRCLECERPDPKPGELTTTLVSFRGTTPEYN